VRSNTPNSFKVLVEKLKANHNKPDKILALEEIDEIGDFQDYDILPMYSKELHAIQKQAELKLGQSPELYRLEDDITEGIGLHESHSKTADKPFVKMAACMLQSPIKIAENISQLVVLDLRITKSKLTPLKNVYYPYKSVKIDQEDDIINIDKEVPKMIDYLKSKKSSFANKHIVIVQNDNMHISYVDDEEMVRYMILNQAIQKLKFNNVSILQDHFNETK
jgi:hypothetical protein